VLAANLAQVDTPGFRALDLARNDDFATALSTQMAATQPGHFGGGGTSPAPGTLMVDPNAPVGLDGNGVSLEREAVKIATNQLRYDVLTNLTSSELGDLIWAANDGRG
jgi:flagellar basal-body rod protein FlgB